MRGALESHLIEAFSALGSELHSVPIVYLIDLPLNILTSENQCKCFEINDLLSQWNSSSTLMEFISNTSDNILDVFWHFWVVKLFLGFDHSQPKDFKI